LHHSEDVFCAMIHLPHQQCLLFLGGTAIGDIDDSTHYPVGMTISKGQPASCGNRTLHAVREANDSELRDEGVAPGWTADGIELGRDARPIFWMHVGIECYFTCLH